MIMQKRAKTITRSKISLESGQVIPPRLNYHLHNRRVPSRPISIPGVEQKSVASGKRAEREASARVKSIRTIPRQQ